MGAQRRRDQLPEPECPARQLRTRSCGTRWRTTQHLPSTLRAAGGISFAESSDSGARTLVEFFFLISCKWWSPTACLSVSARRDRFVFKLGEQAHTNIKSWLRAMDLQRQTI